MILPFKRIVSGNSLGKVASRLPQNVAILNIYPFEKLELQAYYFPRITRDPIIDDYIDEGLTNYNKSGESSLIEG
jgi:hypothetical protein